MAKSLILALGLGPREHLAIVGGGGKTSLMFALAGQLRLEGRRVVTATTTKIWHREAQKSPFIVFSRTDPGWRKNVREGLQRHGHVFVCQGLLESGKVEGIKPAVADLLYQDPAVDYLILEADGAAGRPVKAPAEHEPVIPSSATMVVAMMGLEAMGKPLGPGVVFRQDQFESITRLRPGEKLTPGALAKVFQSPDGLFRGCPEGAKRVVFLNKLDLLPKNRDAEDLAGLLLQGPDTPVDLVVVGSILKGNY